MDIERPQEGRNFLALSRKYFPYEESALVASADNSDRAETFVRLWTRKEACTKAAGTRMLGRGLRIPVADFPETTRGVLVHDPTGNVPGVWLVFDVPVPAGYHAAVALDGHEPAQVTMRRWQP